MENIQSFFKYLDKVEGRIPPLAYKLRYAPDTITKEDLHVKGDLNLNSSGIKKLPDNLVIDGYLDVVKSAIEELPKNLKVGLWFDFGETPLAYEFNKKYLQIPTMADLKQKLKEMEVQVGGAVYRY